MAEDEKLELTTDYIETDRDAQEDLDRFLRDVSGRTGLNREQAESTAVAVLCVLDQRLSGGEGMRFAANLPAPLFSLIDRCHVNPNAPAEEFGFEEFIQRAAEHLNCGPGEALRMVRGVFAAAREHLTFVEREHVESQLPAGGLKELWTSPESELEQPPA